METINEYVFGDFIGFGGMKEFSEEQIALTEYSYSENTLRKVILEDIEKRFGEEHSHDAEILKIELNQEISYLYDQYISEYLSACRRLPPV